MNTTPCPLDDIEDDHIDAALATLRRLRASPTGLVSEPLDRPEGPFALEWARYASVIRPRGPDGETSWAVALIPQTPPSQRDGDDFTEQDCPFL